MKVKKITFLAFAVLFVFTFCMFAQEKTTEQSKEYEVTVTKNFRLVDLIVLDDDDEHVTGLKKENIRLWHNGVEQKIISLDIVDYLEKDKIAPAATSGPFLEEVKQREALSKGLPIWQIFVIANVPLNKRLLEKFEEGFIEYIEDNLTARDMAAVYVIDTRGIWRIIGFTSDKKEIIDRVGPVLRKANLPHEMMFARPEAQLKLLNKLREFAVAMRNINGRKNLVLLSAGMPDITGQDYTDVTTGISGSGGASSNVDETSRNLDQLRRSSKEKQELTDAVVELRNKLAETNTTIDIIDLYARRRARGSQFGDVSRSIGLPDDEAFEPDRPGQGIRITADDEQRLAFIRDIAEAGGGTVYEHSLFSSGKLVDYLEELYYINSYYYVIGYEPTGLKSNKDGSDKIEIEVKPDDEDIDIDRLIYKRNVPTLEK